MKMFEMPWGNKIYRKLCPPDLYDAFMQCRSYEPPCFITVIRGKEISFLIDGMFMVWPAVFLDEIEPELLDWIDSIPEDSIFYDVGASIGSYTTYAAVTGKKCYAFEPEAQNFSALEMHHFLNKTRIKHAISSFNLSIGDTDGIGYIYCQTYSKGSHRKIFDKEIDEYKHKQISIQASLDGMLKNIPCPEYLKIDVDGSEENVLEGARGILSGDTLQEVFIEVSDYSKESVYSIMDSYGFYPSHCVGVEAYNGIYNVIFKRK